jgi:hypothetical protein
MNFGTVARRLINDKSIGSLHRCDVFLWNKSLIEMKIVALLLQSSLTTHFFFWSAWFLTVSLYYHFIYYVTQGLSPTIDLLMKATCQILIYCWKLSNFKSCFFCQFNSITYNYNSSTSNFVLTYYQSSYFVPSYFQNEKEV